MDIEVISIKQVLRFSILSIIILAFITSVSLFKNRASVSLCSEQSQLTIVIENELHEHLLISNASVKNILDCLGRSMPFYTRTITYAHIDHSSKLSDVSKRYQIQNVALPKEFSQFVIASKEPNLYSVSHGSEKILVYTRPPSSPFSLLKELQGSSTTVYMPQNLSKEQGVLEKMIKVTGERIKVLKNGTFYRSNGLLRS